MVRTNPYFVPYTTTGNGQTSISIAGRNNRYNNVQIDGSVDNDVFGLSSSGTPEGQTNSQPISLDAIQEIQLLVSPYDVRQGGFTGGGVNEITKSGTNAFSGTAFIFGRDQKLVGNYYNPNKITAGVLTPGESLPLSRFSDKQGGGSFGGPIIKNRLFFFASVDDQREHTPTGVSAANFVNQAGVEAVITALEGFGYKPAANVDGEFNKRNYSDKIFGRVDMNLGKGEQLTIRHNFVHGIADIGTPTTNTSYLLPDAFYSIDITTHSTVAQLNTAKGRWVNEARFGWTHVLALRGAGPGEVQPFPFVSVTLTSGVTVKAGRDNSSTANQLEQRIAEINDDLTAVIGKHTLSFGTHDEFFKFSDLFIQNTFGNYSFNTIADLQAGLAQSYTFGYANVADPNARFNVYQWGGYAGDAWRARKDLTITSGIRVDVPHFPNVPDFNPVSATNFGYSTSVVPHPVMMSPRVGFNYDTSDGKGDSQIRGGIGIFSGRTPYVWLSNQYGNTGIDFGSNACSFSTSNNIVFIPNPSAQTKTPTGCTAGATTQTINVVDPNYKFPKLLRGNIA